MKLFALLALTVSAEVTIPAETEFESTEYGFDAQEVERLTALGVVCDPDKRIVLPPDAGDSALLAEVTAANTAFKLRNDELLAELDTKNVALAAAHQQIDALTAEVQALKEAKKK